MPTIDEMSQKMQQSLSAMQSPDFWQSRLKKAEQKLQKAEKRALAAKTPKLKAFWQYRVERAQRSVNYLKKRAAKLGKAPSTTPQEIADRWRNSMR